MEVEAAVFFLEDSWKNNIQLNIIKMGFVCNKILQMLYFFSQSSLFLKIRLSITNNSNDKFHLK